MDELETAIQKAHDAVAIAASELKRVEEHIGARLRDGAVLEEAEQHVAGTALALSEAEGGLHELREALSGGPAYAAPAR